jgi:hypothetical protein
MREIGDGPVVTRVSLLSMQVCVPADWTDEQTREFANRENLCGITNGWVVSSRAEVAPVPCEGRNGFKHIILDC